jgi:hypothetical protein
MAARMVKYRFVGVSSLLTHNPQAMKPGGKGLGMKTIPTPTAEAEAGLYVDDKGNYYIRPDAFRSAVIGKGGSASGRKIGKRTAIQVVSAGVFVVEENAVLVHPDTGKPLKEYVVDSRRAVVQGNGVVRSRPKFPKWATTVVFEVDEDFVTVEQFTELLTIAGKMCGVGDYRVQCKGPFGRFSVELVAK